MAPEVRRSDPLVLASARRRCLDLLPNIARSCRTACVPPCEQAGRGTVMWTAKVRLFSLSSEQITPAQLTAGQRRKAGFPKREPRTLAWQHWTTSPGVPPGPLGGPSQLARVSRGRRLFGGDLEAEEIVQSQVLAFPMDGNPMPVLPRFHSRPSRRIHGRVKMTRASIAIGEPSAIPLTLLYCPSMNFFAPS